VPADLRTALNAALPNATWYRQRALVAFDLADRGDQQASPFTVVADSEVMRLLGLDQADRAALDRYGVATPARFTGDTPTTSPTIQLQIGDGKHTRTVEAAVLRGNERSVGGGKVFITPQKAQALGLTPVDLGWYLQNPHALTDSERGSLDAITNSLSFNADGSLVVMLPPSSSSVSQDAILELILIVATLAALGVLAMMLALSSAEARDERDVLVSLGARPRTMKGVAATKAGVLAFVSAAIAVPAGYIPIAVVEHAGRGSFETVKVPIPWSSVVQLLLLAPLVAVLIAFVGSGIAQRVRPTRASTFAVD
jgi:hypothetical protein